MRTERQKLYSVYQWAKSRCTNPNVKQYNNWGGRGIQFKFTSFDEFLAELGPRPLGYSLDRIDNDGHYEKGNVKWSTRKEQNCNKGSYANSTTGITGLTILYPKGKYKTTRFVARGYVGNKRVEFYKGPSKEFAEFVLEEYNDKKKRSRLYKTY